MSVPTIPLKTGTVLPPNAPAVEKGLLLESIRWPTFIGMALIAVFIIGFGAWGALAPLAGGALAPGVVSPDGNRRTVQHLEGGIIAQLHVRDGDVLEAGQPLVDLESVQPKATHDALLNQHRTLVAMQARLTAEQANLDEIVFPVELQTRQKKGSGLGAIVAGQRDLFRSRREMHIARKRVLLQKIEQLNEQINALQAQVESTEQQSMLIKDELDGKRQLFNKNLLPKPEIRRLERAEAEIRGKNGEYRGMIAKAKEQIGEANMQVVTLEAERTDEISNKLDETRLELATVSEKLLASEDVLRRTVVVSPVRGTVVNLRVKTVGGVLKPGEPIADIVPIDDSLVIDSRVMPMDIDVVHAGLSAQVHFTAFVSRAVPRVTGTVQTVSADRLMDENTRQPYYLARVQVSREALAELGPGVELVPGMPAEVLIVTGERTMWQYLLQPFVDAFRRSFREV